MSKTEKWSELIEAGAVTDRLRDQLEKIFFESSGTKTFASDEAKKVFRERWLERYLRVYPQWAYLVRGADDAVQGYLLGSLDDPARTPLFSDVGYFSNFADLTARYPAQIHINVTPYSRSNGVGGRLIELFAGEARGAGCKGVHVVTGRGMRNVDFYGRNGFRELGHIDWQGRELVFLARSF